jgi:cytochrome c-type biogenesis protein CcmH
MRLTHVAFASAIFAATSSLGLSVAAEPAAPAVDIGEKVPGAERLEGRLLAPCCWAQTLDIHGSEIANSLRREIRTRLKAGESPEAVEQSLVARYGQRIRAVPDRVPLNMMGEFGWFGVAAAAGFLGFVLWQWLKRGRSYYSKIDPGTRTPDAAEQNSNEASDERLEAELHRINDN